MAEAEAAGNAFAAHDTKTTLSALQQVRKQRDNDPKVLHNLAVAEYMDGGQRDPRKLLSTLEGLKQRLEDARSEAEFGEGDALGDTDPSLTAYNMAVLLYQQKQYARCRTLLEDMFTNIEPIDEFLAFKLCFLLLDVYLLQRQAERAAEVLAQLEKSYAVLTKMDGDKQNGEADGAAVGATGATGGADGKGAAGEDWPNKRSSRRPPTDITPEEVRSALSLYKAKLALMARSSKSSKREIKTTLNACAQNTTGLFLKCNLEWQRQNYRKAIKLLNNSCQTTEREKNVSALYFNNMGCIHHCMRRHQAAAFYFTRALQENDTLYGDAKEGHSLPTFSCDRRCELEYNRGLQYLFLGRPEAAFTSLMVALDLLHSQPRLWLRLGEACVGAHVQQQTQQQASAGVPSVSSLVSSLGHGAARGGGGRSRYLLLRTDGPVAAGKTDAGPPSEEETQADSGGATIGSPAAPAPTLAFGLKCLRNALLLCGVQLGSAGLASVTAAEYAALLQSSANGTLSTAEELTLQLHSVQRLALLHLAYVSLSLGDAVPALSWASQLLAYEACPPSLKVHAHLYACDALCQLNRTAEALDHLTAALELEEPISSVASWSGSETAPAADGEGLDSVRNPYSSMAQQSVGGTGREGSERATLYTNLAVVHVLRGDAPQATGYVRRALEEQPSCRQALLCCVYLELQAGRTEVAVEILKKQRAPVAK